MTSSVLLLSAGDTISHFDHAHGGKPILAVVVEAFQNGSVELEGGQVISKKTVVPYVTGEEWTPIAGYTDRYLISSYGKVVSIQYHNTSRKRLLKVLRPNIYPMVALCKGAGPAQVGINRLVAMHFLPAPTLISQTCVLPKDGDHLNLHAENLQWADPCDVEDKLVFQHMYRKRSGEGHHSSRLTTAEVIEVRNQAEIGTKHQRLADRFGVSRPTISLMVNGLVRSKG